MNTDNHMNSHSPSALLPAESFSDFGKEMLSAYCNLKDRVDSWKVMDGADLMCQDWQQ